MAKKTVHRRHQPPRSDPTEAPLADIRAAFAKGRDMLAWADDWDGEGSPGYDEATWSRAREFLLEHAAHLWHSRQLAIPAPEILPGPAGSIDLEWRPPARELLLTIPAAPDGPIQFYGERAGQGAVKGNLLSSQATRRILA